MTQIAESLAPDVSVVIAARNEALHVEEAIRTILAQRGVSFELVFIDDCSTDDTLAIATRAASGHANARVMPSPGRGKVVAFNYGVSIARGDWVCLFSGDDIMPQDSLAGRLAAVRAVPSDKPVIGLSRLITMSEHKSQDGHVVPRSPHKGAFSGVSYLMDRSAKAMFFPVPEHFPNEDTWMEVAAQHLDVTLVHSGVIGCQWRVHDGNSINLLVPFDQFNAKYTPRMAAAEAFLDRWKDQLTPESRRRLQARVRCENARKTGDLLGIATSGARPVQQLRALALSNAFFYDLRRRLYGLLSGW